MRLATISTRAATPMRVATTLQGSSFARSEFELRAGQPAPEGVPFTPAFGVVKRYGKDLLSMPGVTALGWNARDTNIVRVFVGSDYAGGIARRVLERSIDGVEIQLLMEGTRDPYTGPESSSIGDCIHAVASMPGVWNYTYQFAPSRGTAMFRTINQATIDRLDPLIVNHFTVEPDRYGNPRTFDLIWRAGI